MSSFASPIRRPVSTPKSRPSPVTNVTNQAILQSRLNKIDSEFKEIHSILHAHDRPHPSSTSVHTTNMSASGTRTTSANPAVSNQPSASQREASAQRHRDRLARAAAASGPTQSHGRDRSERLPSPSPFASLAAQYVHATTNLSSSQRPLSARELLHTSPPRYVSTVTSSRTNGLYSPGGKAKEAAAKAISSPIKADLSSSQFSRSHVTSPTRTIQSNSNNPNEYYPNPNLSSPSHQSPNSPSPTTAFHSSTSGLAPLPALPPSALLDNNAQPSPALPNGVGISQTVPYVLSQNFPTSFTSTMTKHDRRLDAYLEDHLRESSYRLQKLKAKIVTLQSNADMYLAQHDVELTGLKRDELVEEVNYEIALLEKEFRAERLEAENHLSEFLEKDKADRLASFKQVLASEGEESIERIRSDYLRRRNEEIEEARAEITGRRDAEVQRLRKELEAENRKQVDEITTIFEAESRASIEEERLKLESAQTQRLSALKEDLEKNREEELRLMREKFHRATSLKLTEEEEKFKQARTEKLAELKSEIRLKLETRLQESITAWELNQKRQQAEWEAAQTQEYESKAKELSDRYGAKLIELKQKAHEDFLHQKDVKLKALETKLVEEMKVNLAEQMTTLKKEFLTTREDVKSKLETELRERHAYELHEYRRSLQEERTHELEDLTARLKKQSDEELIEVTHELQAEKQASLQAIHTQFERERETWLLKLQAAYEIDRQLAEDKLIKQYEQEKIMSITDLRVTLANRKHQALESLTSKYEQEKALKVASLNQSLAALRVTPENDADLQRVKKALGNEINQVEKFSTLTQKIQKLQQENASLKGSKDCKTCQTLLAQSHDKSLAKHAREQYQAHQREHHR